MYWRLVGVREKKFPPQEKKKQVIMKNYIFSLAVCTWANHTTTLSYFT